MLKLPPPIWALVYVLTAAAISWLFGWSKVLGFPLVALGSHWLRFRGFHLFVRLFSSTEKAPRSNPRQQLIASLLRAVRINLLATPCT